ncbi:MAG TPA: PQQ-binding-like beta-propeller repeat protein [Terriglobia bacterium]|nr:PQQ-binding-like beta-propeller repeat protein [Terriglobia bacterium]
MTQRIFFISAAINGPRHAMTQRIFFISAAILFAILAPAGAQRPSGGWPSFRGDHAAGVADGQGLPTAWDGEKGTAIRWKQRIPGLGHSSPIVWDDSVFVTSAVSSRPDATFRRGLFGDGDASDDRSPQQWTVFSLDKRSGRILWERVAYEGVPRDKRHVKSTYASATPATDGRYLIAFFGSQGLYAYDMKGELVWKKNLGHIDTGAYDAPDYEWGPASSPIIYRDLVIVQCDQQRGSFLMAVDIRNGTTVWKAERDELPSWATPTVYGGPGRAELITNSPNFIRSYDPETGKELWRLGGSSKITAPTPILTGDLIIVASGRSPEAPVFAIRRGASGDISLRPGETSSRSVAWAKQRAGPYMPTPLVYRDCLYVLRNEGILACFDPVTGETRYVSRVPHQGSGFSASPVAADGKIYLSSEDGDITVIKAGPEFEVIGVHSMGQPLMATPAISDGMMFIRGEKDLFAVGRQP